MLTNVPHPSLKFAYIRTCPAPGFGGKPQKHLLYTLKPEKQGTFKVGVGIYVGWRMVAKAEMKGILLLWQIFLIF